MKDGQVRAAPSYVLLLGGRASCCGSTTVPHSPTPLPMGSNASFFWFGSTFCVPDKANKESWKRGEGPLKSRSHKAQSMLLLQVLRTKLWSYKNWCEQFFFVLAENDLAKPGRALHIEFMVLWLCCTHCEKRISAVVQRVFYWILRLDTLRTICYRQLIKPLKKVEAAASKGFLLVSPPGMTIERKILMYTLCLLTRIVFWQNRALLKKLKTKTDENSWMISSLSSICNDV